MKRRSYPDGIPKEALERMVDEFLDNPVNRLIFKRLAEI